MPVIADFAKAGIRSTLNRVGLHVTSARKNPDNQVADAIRHFEPDIVLDIGANIGQFSASLRQGGYRGRIHCIEPLSDAHKQLKRRFANDLQTIVHDRLAISDHSDCMERMHIANNSVSSSLLDMADAHVRAAPHSRLIGHEDVEVTTLDQLYEDKLLGHFSDAFLKIDTQGAEWRVLDGATHVLSRTKIILIELSTAPLYVGQRLWEDIYKRLSNERFDLWALMPGLTDPDTGQTLQFDAIMVREPL